MKRTIYIILAILAMSGIIWYIGGSGKIVLLPVFAVLILLIILIRRIRLKHILNPALQNFKNTLASNVNKKNNTPLHILLADDDTDDCHLFKKAFAEMKINTSVHIVNDGEQLMDYLTEEANPLPNLIFLDLNMPRKDGLECLQEIRRNKKFKNISIAIYSTSNSETAIDQTFLNGANIYIRKPNDLDSVKKILEKAVITTQQYQMPGSALNREGFILKL